MQTANSLLYDVETQIMENIVTFLSRGSVASADWQIERLEAYGALNTENRKIIEKFRGKISSLSEVEIQEAMKSALAEIEPQFLKASKAGANLLDALPPNASPALRDMLASYQGRAVANMNYTMQTLLSNAGDVYIASVNKASLLLLSGSITPDQAIAQTVREWAKSGIPSIVDKAGRQWSTESYAQMVMRSTVRSVTTDTQFTRCDEYGTDLIEVSSHVDARPGCAPYQGRVFSRNGKTKGYPNFGNTTYGEASGILGVNCRHQIFPFFPGVSTQTFPERPFDEEAYKASQTQRRYERDIRQSKRELAVMEKSGNAPAISQAKATLQGRQKNMRDFLEESKRTRRYSREQIYDGGIVKPTPIVPKAPVQGDFGSYGKYVKAKREYAEKYGDSIKAPVTKSVDIPKSNKTHRKQLNYSGEDNAIKQIQSDLNVPIAEAKKVQDSVRYYTSDGYKKIRDANTSSNMAINARNDIETLISKAPSYSGKIYRGIQLDDNISKEFVSRLKNGAELDMKGISSWTADSQRAEWFAKKKDSLTSIIFECENKTGVGVQHLSMVNVENEILHSKSSKFIIDSVESSFDNKGKNKVFTVKLKEKL